jgi:Protein of unknown function (DUF1580)
MFDLTSETPIRLDDAAKLVPPSRGGKRTHISTILRWILTGAKSPTGESVKLEAARLGGKWVTSREALQRFSERLTPDLNQSNEMIIRSPNMRRKAVERAEKQLDQIGI